MSRSEYQRAVADLMRDPDFVRKVRTGTFTGYQLSEVERKRLIEVARRPGMSVGCMLYRASRLVGISRRVPELVEALGADFPAVFDAYLAACPNARPQFDDEACAFADFVARQVRSQAQGKEYRQR